MNTKSLLKTTALLGVAALLFAGPSAKAALTYNAGDLFIGFHATGGTGSGQDYLINIGSYTQFNLANGGTINLTLGNVGADLVANFGADWATRSDLSWGVIGTSYDGVANQSPVIFASRQRSQVTLAQSTPWKGKAESTQITTAGNVQGLTGYYSTIGTATGNVPKGTFQDATAENSYAYWTNGALDFAAYSTIEGNFASGASNTVLDLYQVNPVFNQNAAYLGKFTISGSGAITYSAVPEPSSMAFVGVGAAALAIVIRRRKATRA